MSDINERAAYQARKFRTILASNGTTPVKSEEDIVKEILEQNGGAMKKEEITEGMRQRNPHLDKNDIVLASSLTGEALSKLEKRGEIERIEHGVYRIKKKKRS